MLANATRHSSAHIQRLAAARSDLEASGTPKGDEDACDASNRRCDGPAGGERVRRTIRATGTRRFIGGWAILKTDSKAEAIQVATEFMELHRKYWPGFEGESELRPMFDPGMGP